MSGCFHELACALIVFIPPKGLYDPDNDIYIMQRICSCPVEHLIQGALALLMDARCIKVDCLIVIDRADTDNGMTGGLGFTRRYAELLSDQPVQ